MKKIITTIVGIVCIAILACLALPKYFSSQNKIFVQNFLNGVQQGSNGQLTGKIVSEADGWFSSNSTIQFTYQFSHAANPISGQFDLSLLTKYGPVLWTQHGLHLGQAYTQYTVKNNKQSAAYFADPLLQGNALLKLTGNAKIDFSGFKIIAPQTLKFDGINGTAKVNKKVTVISGKIDFGKFQITNPSNPNAGVVVMPFTQTFSLTRPTPNSLWSGNKDIEIPSINIQSNNFHAQFNNVSLKSNATIEKQLLNGSMNISVPDFTVNNQKGNYQAVLTLTNLNANAFDEIRALANSINPQENSPEVLQNYAMQLSHYAIDVFSGKSAIQFNSTLNFGKLGSLVVSTGYDNSAPTSKINFTAKIFRQNNVFAGVDLNVQGLDKASLGKLLHLSLSLDPQLNPAAQQQLQNPTQLQATINNLIPQLFTKQSQVSLNIVLPSDSKSGFQLLDAKAYFNQLPQHPIISDIMTQAQLDANWKIPTYATEIVKVFAPIVISKIEDPKHQADATEAYNLFEQMLPSMIQQGYLVQQGNYYISTWNITSQALLMNNKPLQPLLAQLMQLMQQQQQANGTTPTSAAPVTDSVPALTPAAIAR